MSKIIVTKERVDKILKGLNITKAMGPDNIHPRVLKELASKLSEVMAKFFKQSIDTEFILSEWKKANICPLFKKNDLSQVATGGVTHVHFMSTFETYHLLKSDAVLWKKNIFQQQEISQLRDSTCKRNPWLGYSHRQQATCWHIHLRLRKGIRYSPTWSTEKQTSQIRCTKKHHELDRFLPVQQTTMCRCKWM